MFFSFIRVAVAANLAVMMWWLRGRSPLSLSIETIGLVRKAPMAYLSTVW